MTDDPSVFVPGLGFRSSRGGLRLPEPVTITRDNDCALRIMGLSSTERGTELTFELRDKELEAQCSVAVTDPRWTSGVEVRLRDGNGAVIAALPPGAGQRLSFGQHRFGPFRRELVFERLNPDVRGLSVELRGELGDWDAALHLVPLAESGVIPVVPIGAEQERDATTVRVRGVATTPTATYLDIETTAAPPVRSILGIGAWMVRHGDERLTLVDEHGQRFEDVYDEDLPRPNPHDSRRTIATFPPLSSESRELTLVVPAVIVEESDSSLEVPLPVFAPTDAMFGRYPMTVRWADIVEDLRQAPGEAPARGVEVQLKLGSSNDERRVLRPSRINVDGVRNWSYGLDYANPDGPVLKVRLPAGGSAKTVTLLDPVVEVRGPWEVRWRR